MHCFCEANLCADCLARIGSVQERPFILYQDLPVDLLELLCSDRSGLYVNRTVANPPVPPWFGCLMNFPFYQKKKKKIWKSIVE